jgi:hypothetical protein
VIDRQSVRNKAELDGTVEGEVVDRSNLKWTRGIVNQLKPFIGCYKVTDEMRDRWVRWIDEVADDPNATFLEKMKVLELLLQMECVNIKAAEAIRKLTEAQGGGGGGNTIRVKLDFPNQRRVKNEAKPAE